MVRKSLFLILSLAGSCFADTGFKDTIQFKELDGSPQCMAGQVVVGNGQLTCSGQTATLTITGSGGGGSSSLETMANGVRVSSPTASIDIRGSGVTAILVGGVTAQYTISGGSGSGIVSPGTFTWQNTQGISLSTAAVSGQLTAGTVRINEDSGLVGFTGYALDVCSNQLFSMTGGSALALGDASGVCGTVSSLVIKDDPNNSTTFQPGSGVFTDGVNTVTFAPTSISAPTGLLQIQRVKVSSNTILGTGTTFYQDGNAYVNNLTVGGTCTNCGVGGSGSGIVSPGTFTWTNTQGIFVSSLTVTSTATFSNVSSTTFTNVSTMTISDAGFDVSGSTTNMGILLLNGSPGNNAQVLTSAGSGLSPTWTTPSAGGGASTLFISTSIATITMPSAVASTITLYGIGTTTITANTLTVGKSVEIDFYGFWSTGNSGNLQFIVKFGTFTVIDTQQSNTSGVAVTKGVVDAVFVFTTETTGGSGTIIPSAKGEAQTSSTAVIQGGLAGINTNLTTATIDTTMDLGISLYAKTGAGAGGSIQPMNIIIKYIN